VLVAMGGRAVAWFALSDTPKGEARAAIDALRELGVTCVMASGDVAASATAIAKELGIDDVRAGLRPTDKAGEVAKLRATGKVVGFVGDGVNDAAALASADVGIAMGTGSDIAVDAGDLVAMRGDLFAIVDAVRLARASHRVVRQNFFWAYAYNAALVPLAAGALYPVLGVLFSPVLAAAAMAASSLFVLGNSLRLRSFGRSPRPLAALGAT
jgi:Cu+-exporting ATPase